MDFPCRLDCPVEFFAAPFVDHLFPFERREHVGAKVDTLDQLQKTRWEDAWYGTGIVRCRRQRGIAHEFGWRPAAP